MRRPYRIFISSPVDEYETYREEILRCAKLFRLTGSFEFFFYEEHENKTMPGKTIAEAIYENSGDLYDAMFVSFRNRVGEGTVEELKFFNETIATNNPNAELWWCKAYCSKKKDGTVDFQKSLHNSHAIELPIFDGELLLRRPSQLVDRLHAHLMRKIAEWLRDN